MSPMPKHEKYTERCFSLLLDEAARELDVDIGCFGSMTCKREDLDTRT